MTAQFSELLRIEGKTRALCAEPLGNYFVQGGTKPEFVPTHTALWRGYVGTWEISDGRLYLIHLKGTLRDGTAASVESIFPGYPDRVFARWFSGDLYLPEGELLQYVHAGYASMYERDRIISVKKGVVVADALKVNGKAKAKRQTQPRVAK